MYKNLLLKFSVLTVIVVLLFSCSETTIYVDKHDLPNSDSIVRIEFRHAGTEICDKSLFNEFEINNKSEIKKFVSILQNSEIDGPWKGTCFDQIDLVTAQSVFTISTNGEVFGHGNSGIFYRFPDENTIDKFRLKNGI